jgi:hypothetical protein
MREPQKKVIIDKLTFIINGMPDLSSFHELLGPKSFIPGKKGGLRLVGDGYVEFNNLCDMFQAEKDWKDKFSHEYIEEEVVTPLLNSALFNSDTGYLQHELEAIVSKCDNYAEEHTAFLPIEGISMHIDQLVLGKNTLRNMTGEYFKTFEQKVISEILRHETLQEKSKIELKVWHEVIKDIIQGKIVATYTTVAEPFRTQELAELECDRVIDILRYFAYIKDQSINFGLPWKLARRWSKVAVASSTYEFSFRSGVWHGEFEYNDPKTGMLFELTDQTLLEMKQEGIYDLISVQPSKKKKIFIDTLLFSIHWFINALMQDEPANEFLSLAVCLETFLTPGDTSKSISNALAIGVAWVLGKDFAERQALYNKMKKLYSKRSSITHSGNRDIPAHELLDLRETVKAFLQAMIRRRNEFNTGGDKTLQLWIDSKVLGAP